MNKELYEDEQIHSSDLNIVAAFKNLLPFLRAHKKRLYAALALLGGVTGLSLLWPILVQQVIDEQLVRQLELEPALREFEPIIVLGLAIVAIQLATIVMQYYQRVMLETVGQDIMLDLKKKLFEHVLSLDVSFFDKNPVGRLMSRIESDTESLRLLFTNTVVLVIGDLLLIFGIFAVMFYKEWRLALALLTVMPVLIIMIWIFHKLTSHRFLIVRKRMAEVTATLTEYLHGMSIVQIFHRGEYTMKKVYDANERKFKEDAFVNMSVVLFFNLLFYMEYVKIGLALLLGSWLGVSPGIIVLFILLIWREFDPIARTADQLGNFQKGLAGARRIFGLLEIKPRLTDADNPVAWPGLKDAIRFENVSFSYNDDDNYVLRDVSFEIPAGSRVALAGVTGGGKSTVVNLMFRFYDPQKGRITIDGVDIRTIATSELRKRFALVLQDIILFPGDIAENIGLEAEEIDRSKIETAAKTVAADEFIEKLPDRYQTKVSEKGANFSRGERQLLSFARALAFDPELLILDEATSSVDPETERTIQNSLKKLTSGRTSIIIAHRLSTILDVDQILVIRKGEIVERGTHTELILAGGYYSKLFHLQFKNKNGALTNVK
ncbi:MAG: ABC transporter ATP-binding protein [candidate division Zixibacteria bacterium]|nr:ABC transporter ATP-binding protein [candidate division Zixibacteria bacterium]